MPATPPEPSAAPLHVAIVMDGNGRWAKRRGLPRSLGHRAGVESLKRTVAAAPDLNIRWLTMFGFSTENWSRPAAEVSELMALPKRYFESDLARLEREGVRVRTLGRREGLAPDLTRMLDEAERRTAKERQLLPADRLQLWRPGRHRRRRPALRRGGGRRPRPSGRPERDPLRRVPVLGRGAAAGPGHPAFGRA
jgi:hypothetical protein